jgi:Flp pilus assembly pilin Flp
MITKGTKWVHKRFYQTGVTSQLAWERTVNQMRSQLRDQKGQGTTEYAILVGVLVVIAILAIVVFRPKLEQLWRSITEAMEQL